MAAALSASEKAAREQIKNFEGVLEHVLEEQKQRKQEDTTARADLTEERRKENRPDIDRTDVVFADGGVSYSIALTKTMNIEDQIEQVESKTLNGSNSLYLGNCNNLYESGVYDAPFAMDQGDYRKSRRKEGNNKKYSSHAVKKSVFLKLKDLLDQSVMFISNETKITIITDSMMADENGNPSYIVAGVWQDQYMDKDNGNMIKSVYPLKDFAIQLERAAKKGKLIIIDKNKATDMLARIGVQPAERTSILDLAKSNIPQTETESQEAKQSRALDNAFEAWANDSDEVKYSRSLTGTEWYEQTRDLMAVHSTTAEKLAQALKWTGLSAQGSGMKCGAK